MRGLCYWFNPRDCLKTSKNTHINSHSSRSHQTSYIFDIMRSYVHAVNICKTLKGIVGLEVKIRFQDSGHFFKISKN